MTDIQISHITDAQQKRKGRLMLVCMLIFFTVPIIAVLAMYKMDWRPTGSSYGELIVPAKLLNVGVQLQDSAGQHVGAEFWKDKWSMVYVASECEANCMERLHIMRQLHVSLYKEIPRMQRVLITTTSDANKILDIHPELRVINQPVEPVISLSRQFGIGQEDATHTSRIYLVDPLGHLMMSYKVDASPALIRKDITRLMKYSWAG